MSETKGRIPTLFIQDESIPGAYWQLLDGLIKEGMDKRTEYDRKDANGEYIDSPSKDAKAFIEVRNPFFQPRHPPMSYCHKGKYIAEVMGAKNHLVLPYDTLVEKIAREGKATEDVTATDHIGEATEWPYLYNQRLFAYPTESGEIVNQMEAIVNKLANSPDTRRAVATTRLPPIDTFLKEDIPCLGEIQLRLVEDGGDYYLNMHANWRSRDAHKAWADNVIALTVMQSYIARDLTELMGKNVHVGPYTESSGSIHIYGQDFVDYGMDKFQKNFPNRGSFISRCMTSNKVGSLIVVPELQDLLGEEQWKFPDSSKKLIQMLIDDFEGGRMTC